MKCAIMQPTYLPWPGYFNLIAQVDIFVFLDDVQFEKRSWQSRNRVLLNSSSHWLTVPVKLNSRSQKINSVLIDEEQNWREKHRLLLNHAYARNPFKHQITELVELICDDSLKYLADLNIELIKACAKNLCLNTTFLSASEINAGGKRSEHLLNICRKLGCTEYLSPIGSADYLKEDGLFTNSEVRLSFQNFAPKSYVQLGSSDFISHLSIVDVIANMSWQDASIYITNGEVI